MEITKAYYDEMRRACDRMVDFYHDVCRGANFTKAFGEMKVEMGDGREFALSSLVDSPQKAMNMDLIACYWDLTQRDVDFGEKEALPLLYTLLRVADRELELTLEQYLAIPKVSLDLVAGNMNRLMASVQKNPSRRAYVVAKVLDWCDKEQEVEFLVNLYRMASFVAKADGRISDKESVALANIMRLKELSARGGDEPSTFVPAAPTECDPVDGEPTAMDELNGLVGLDTVKREVGTLYNYVRVQNSRRRAGMRSPDMSYHCVFVGNPGTGKTTVARILAKIYHELGVVGKGHLVETDRSGLVAEYVGQTAVKTNKTIDGALDGVLFVDEAYALMGGESDYGREAVSTLLKRMEDDRERLVVVLAGYGKEMEQLLASNPGLKSRFNRVIRFDDYSAEEMALMFRRMAEKYDYHLEVGCERLLTERLEAAVGRKEEGFGNGRFVRNMFERTLEIQANRLAASTELNGEALSLIKSEDVAGAFEERRGEEI